jgi:hypothetical protein
MATTGILTIADQVYQVTGTSWMDREWSTSALAADQVGWDWFALHLDDGSDVMVYHLRRRDGSIDPYSGGSWRDASGTVTPLTSADITLQPLSEWISPHTGDLPRALATPCCACRVGCGSDADAGQPRITGDGTLLGRSREGQGSTSHAADPREWLP